MELGDTPDPKVEELVKYMLDKKNAPSWVSDIQKQNLGPNYALSDAVAASVAVMDAKDNYVGVVSSLNTWFGSKVSENSIYVYFGNKSIPQQTFRS